MSRTADVLLQPTLVFSLDPPASWQVLRSLMGRGRLRRLRTVLVGDFARKRHNLSQGCRSRGLAKVGGHRYMSPLPARP